MNFFKKLSVFLTFAALSAIVSTHIPVYAEGATVVALQIDNPMMTVDNVPSEIDEGRGTVPVIIDGRTLVPIRAIIEALGGTVAWNGEKSEITLTYKEDIIKLTINSNSAFLNDAESTLDVAPAIINERTMLPIRYIAESFKFNVDWNSELKVVTITKDGAHGSKPNIRVIAIGTDLYFKAPIIEPGFFDPDYFDPYGQPLGDPDGAMNAITPESAEETSKNKELEDETALNDPESGNVDDSSDESAT